MTEIEKRSKVKRKIIRIDEDLCDGCGKCVISCAEGALEIVDGKAKVVNEVFCDGLGACIGECPQGALTIEERLAPEFDEGAVEDYLEGINREETQDATTNSHQCSCPSSQAIVYDQHWEPSEGSGEIPSALRQWPTKLTLVSPSAPYFNSDELLVISDCSPVAHGDFHRKILKGRPIVTVCPMLGLGESELEKLEQILRKNPIETLHLVLMEVPCCQKIKLFLEPIIDSLEDPVEIRETIIGRDGKILREKVLD